MKVLLVDDDAFLRDMYATKFTERGDVVTTAGSGQLAIDALRQESFDIVVLDMVMPQMTGIELIKAIKAEFKEQRCIVLSNQGETFDKKGAEDAGALGYIVKADLVPSEVVEQVHNILEASR